MLSRDTCLPNTVTTVSTYPSVVHALTPPLAAQDDSNRNFTRAVPLLAKQDPYLVGAAAQSHPARDSICRPVRRAGIYTRSSSISSFKELPVVEASLCKERVTSVLQGRRFDNVPNLLLVRPWFSCQTQRVMYWTPESARETCQKIGVRDVLPHLTAQWRLGSIQDVLYLYI